jgi:hypothetical protein
MYIYVHIHTYTYTVYTTVSNQKQKPRHFSLIRLPFAHPTNVSLLIFRLLTKKPMEVIVSLSGERVGMRPN